MLKPGYLFAVLALGGAIAVPRLALAQYGGQGMGSALSNNAMVHQGTMRAGVDDMARRASKETPFKIIKDVKLGLKDADPNVRVGELNKLRWLKDAEVNEILLTAMSDPDLRVKIKAIDLLGAREANVAVPAMDSMLFLRSTEPIVKLHLIAALGRIGDAQATLPVMQFLSVEQDERGRGTAVFALGEIGSDQATPVLTKVIAEDNSPMVRRLAQEATQKISGELPTEHKKELASQTNKEIQPTDQKLAKIREMDKKLQDMER
ncbi:MAG: HEAT repeat domain-containing protein [Candidatus Binatus sp.]|uniref:HEAT repeat domain-containing protein n=1 Tax=Candidatus Binatus sp. TaxID=2811406 RepID=UPI00271D9E84|nr:HEAT repeat domain-containing protein [Candidatus Binatus sp.]MDO8432209.1 HEAT repeat domain-containing protein [Candidatus Binatus sp.]